jgi:cytochrome P450
VTGPDECLQRQIREFSLHNPALQQDPHALYARLRDEQPIAWSDQHDGFWVLSRYADIQRVFQQPEVFSSCPNVIPAIGQQRPVIPAEIDPPDHEHYRRILNPLFTPGAVRSLRELIRSKAREEVAAIAPRGECEYVAEFAKILPTYTFLTLIGLPPEEGPRFLEWADCLLHGVVEGDEKATQELRAGTGARLYAHFSAELDRRDSAGPTAKGEDLDFLDTLRTASFAGQRPLSRSEILDIIFLVLLGGLDTTQAVLSSTMEYLAGHPETRRELVDNPQLIDTAVEEFLRMFSPAALGRRVTEDTTIGETKMRAGDRVMLLTASAGRDESMFPSAGEVDLRRTQNRHFAFGTGIHRCLGMHLARIELRECLLEWHQRIPDYRIRPNTVVQHYLTSVAGAHEIPLTW